MAKTTPAKNDGPETRPVLGGSHIRNKDGSLERKEWTLHPGDPGYSDAVKAAIPSETVVRPADNKQE